MTNQLIGIFHSPFGTLWENAFFAKALVARLSRLSDRISERVSISEPHAAGGLLPRMGDRFDVELLSLFVMSLLLWMGMQAG